MEYPDLKNDQKSTCNYGAKIMTSAILADYFHPKFRQLKTPPFTGVQQGYNKDITSQAGQKYSTA